MILTVLMVNQLPPLEPFWQREILPSDGKSWWEGAPSLEDGWSWVFFF